jgi:putative phosphonate metabolism protein
MSIGSVADSERRYAVYFDGGESALSRRGSAWLGRDATRSDAPLAAPAVDGVEPERLATLTAEPRRYGFHATLKAPMRLAPGVCLETFLAAVADVAARHPVVALPRLAVAPLGDFLALRPVQPSAALEALAADCVTSLDPLRAPAPAAETARRASAGLTARQRELLGRWGYPYVLDEYRFHCTLTGPVADFDSAEARLIERAARAHFSPETLDSVPVAALAVYEERAPRAPFLRIASLPLRPPAPCR